MTTALATMDSAPRAVWNEEQRKLIRDTFASGASDGEFAALMAVAAARKLDPFLKQIYFVKRWDSQKRCEVWAVQGSIDGLRAIAQRTGLYDGQDEPEFEYEPDGKTLKLARVRVFRKDWARPAVGVAFWKEYVQVKKDGGVSKFWAEKPHVMLAKCAEALALRKAFPEDTGGLYVREELQQEPAEERALNEAPRPQARKTKAASVTVVEMDAPAQLPPVEEPPHDAETGEVIDTPAEPVNHDAIAARMLADLAVGFPNWDAKREWNKVNKPAKDAMPADLQEKLRVAYLNAPPVNKPTKDGQPATAA